MIFKESDFMTINNALNSNSELAVKLGIQFVEKNQEGYLNFINSNDELRQINVMRLNLFNKLLPILLSNKIDFEIYTNKYKNLWLWKFYLTTYGLLYQKIEQVA